MSGNDRILLTPKALDPAELAAGLGGAEDGALITFAGVVRRMEGDQALRAIDYEAYATMAAKVLDQILAEAHDRWAFRAVVAHRTGEVAVGETSVWIGVAAGHRDEAYAASRFLIDELKRRVPIWKREHLPEDGNNAPQA